MGRTLKELLTGLDCNISGNAETGVSALVYDSRKIEKGCAFVCIKGAAFDGHSKIKEAVEKGALTREDMEKAAENVLRLILRID